MGETAIIFASKELILTYDCDTGMLTPDSCCPNCGGYKFTVARYVGFSIRKPSIATCDDCKRFWEEDSR